MKQICVLLAFASTFSCFLADTVGDCLQNDCRSNHKGNIWSYRSNTSVNENEACDQTAAADGTIGFGPDTVIDEVNCQIYRWTVYVYGYDVNVTINHLDLNETAGNYLIISPGNSLVRDEASVVITGKIQTTKKIRVVDHNEVTILLVIQENITDETKKSNEFSLSLTYGTGTTEPPEITTPKPTETAPPDKGNPRDVVVYVKGIRDKFNNTTFTEAVANMANHYCKKKNITTENMAQSDNVELLLITRCSVTWPNWENCIEINMAVAVSVPLGSEYELTRNSLQEMWEEYANYELEQLELEVYKPPPDAEETLYIWLYISVGVAAAFTLLMTALWQLNFFNPSNRKDDATPWNIHKDSSARSDSWISNNSYQELPPMTDLYDNTNIQPAANHEIPTAHTVFSFPPERAVPSEEYGAAFVFQNRLSNMGYDNPSFDVSSEQHHPNGIDYTDFSSDDESLENISRDKRSGHGHLHKAPKQVLYEDTKNESVF